MMFASSGGGRGGNYDDDDYGFEDDFGDEPLGEPEDEEPQRPRSRRTVRAGSSGGGATGGQQRMVQHQPEERYWTDYLRIALPVIGLLLMIGLLWFWATQLIGDPPETTDSATEVVGLVNQGTPEPTDEPAQTRPTQSQGNTIGIGNTASTPESNAAVTPPAEDEPAAGDNQAETTDETTDETGGATFASGDPVVVTEDGVNVRPDATLAGDPMTMLNTGDQLTIASGPVEAEGYIWWEVILPSGDSGWVVEDFIQAAE